jgi:hypothetical protein
MTQSITIIIAGLGIKSNYFKEYVNNYILPHTAFVYVLRPNLSLNEQAIQIQMKLQRYDKRFYHIHCIGFSLGCMLLMKVLETPYLCDKVTFVNPCNLVLDTIQSKHERWYKILWKMPICIKNLYLMYYERTIEKKLHEPPNHMRYLLSKPYAHWENIVSHIGLTTSWLELIKNCSFHRRIRIIQGKKDRYNKFSQLLASEYSDRFSCHMVDGHHHLFVENPRALFLYGCQ